MAPPEKKGGDKADQAKADEKMWQNYISMIKGYPGSQPKKKKKSQKRKKKKVGWKFGTDHGKLPKPQERKPAPTLRALSRSEIVACGPININFGTGLCQKNRNLRRKMCRSSGGRRRRNGSHPFR
mmetsp:Transcript_600/g.794  ORF Transcript_600/g.794 Transcript_600/m.794 type:complete len:125 (-) Transcript_600:263-637(-)